MGEIVEGHGKADTGDEDGGEGLSRSGLAAEPDAHDGGDGDGDGDEKPGNAHGDKVDRRRRGQRGEAVQQYRQDEELHEEQGDAPGPSGLAHHLNGVTRGRVARHRKAQFAALTSSEPHQCTDTMCLSLFIAKLRASATPVSLRLTITRAWQVCGATRRALRAG